MLECLVQGVTSTAAGFGYQVSVEVNCRGDRFVAEPQGNCLITDLLSHVSYPAAQLAAAYDSERCWQAGTTA